MRCLFPAIGAALLASGAVAAEAPIAGAEPPPVEGVMRVGATGIMCVREPCPRRGLIRVDDEGKAEWRPFWSGDKPPEIRADADTQRRIAEAWDEFGCLMVQGRFEKGELTVDRIIGDC